MSVLAPRIDFIAGTRNADRFLQDPSYIYRCQNLQAALSRQGFESGLHHLSGYQPTDAVRAVVLHRPRKSWTLRWLIHRLRKRQIPILADVDDLIFDRKLAQHSPAVVGGIHSLRKAQRIFSAHQSALAWVDHLLASTEPLAEHLRRVYPGIPVSVAHNSVHTSWLGQEVEPRRGNTKIISYCPGTRSHDVDFRVAEAALRRFLQQHPEVQLKITGPLTHNLHSLGAQVMHRPKTSFAQYSQVVQGAWVNLAPLASSPFNACKSALKVLEAGYWNIPTVCSSNRDTDRFHGAGALFANREDDWESHLNALLDPAIYGRHIKGLRERVVARANTDAQARVLLAAVMPESSAAVAE